MYLRIYWGKVAPGAWKMVEKRYSDLMKIEAEGLLGRFVTQDDNDPDSLFTITLWRDLESLQIWEASAAYRDIFLKAVAPYMVGSHTVSLCQVKLHDLRGLSSDLKTS